MLAFLSLYSLTFPPFPNEWSSHTLRFHISLLSSSSVPVWEFLIVQGAISAVSEWVLFHEWFLVISFLSKPPPSSSLSPQPHPSIQMHDAWRKIPEMHFHVPLGMSHNPIPVKQMSYIKLSLWGSHATREMERERGGKRRNKGMIREAQSQTPQATHTNTHRVVTMVRMWLPNSAAYLYIIYLPLSRLSLVNNKESNLWWIYSLFHPPIVRLLSG